MNSYVPMLRTAAVTLSLLACSAVAHASDDQTFNVGNLLSMDVYTQQVLHAPGSFADIFNFSLPVASDVAGGNVSLTLSLGSLNIYKIDNPSISLYDTLNPSVLLASGINDLTVNNLGLGNYFVKVGGTASGVLGGNYLFGLAALPVPEPAQWMLFAAGFLAVGSMARRRIGH